MPFAQPSEPPPKGDTPSSPTSSTTLSGTVSYIPALSAYSAVNTATASPATLGLSTAVQQESVGTALHESRPRSPTTQRHQRIIFRNPLNTLKLRGHSVDERRRTMTTDETVHNGRTTTGPATASRQGPSSWRRPLLPSRQVSSYSKRHASFDSPREIPLPSPHPSSMVADFESAVALEAEHERERQAFAKGLLQSTPEIAIDDARQLDTRSQCEENSGSSVFESESSESSTDRQFTFDSDRQSPRSSLSSLVEAMDIASQAAQEHAQTLKGKGKERDEGHGMDVDNASKAFDGADTSPSRSVPHITEPQPISPSSRPYSMPDASQDVYSPRPLQASAGLGGYDRTSTSSLPLPFHTPYSALPSIRTPVQEESHDPERPQSPFKAAEKHPRSEVSSPQPGAPSGPSSPTRPRGSTASSPAAHHEEEDSNSDSEWDREPVEEMPTPSLASLYFPTETREREWARRNGVTLTRQGSTASEGGVRYHPHRSAPSPEAQQQQQPPPPPPDPPQVLPPVPPAYDNPASRFLGASGPAIDAPVTVETTPADYRLMIPLVGFNREMMTLSARRNRILHILADSWAPGGGHFERRISFGYDADIPRVRAEYDGELLTVTVPRRAPPRHYFGTPVYRG